MANVSNNHFSAEKMDSATSDFLLAPESDGLSTAWSPQKLSGNEASKTPTKRKLSESRGVNLPDIKLHPETVALAQHEDSVVDTPLPTSSPLGAFNRAPFDDRQSPRTVEHRLTEIIDICIFMPDHKGLVFKVAGGRSATAAQLLRMVYEHHGISDFEKADQLFALWMCSPLLEVQLKPHHCPFSIRLQWRGMLQRFTSAGDEHQLLDEPMVMVRRNVYLSKRRQLLLSRVGDAETDILFRDARECIMNGSYPCPMDTCLQLTAYDMVLSWGTYNSQTHTLHFVRSRIEEIMPCYHVEATKRFSLFGWSLAALSCRGFENQLIDLYRTASSMSPVEIKREYLITCMRIPVYGAAFFSGYVERPAAFGSAYSHVVVAISREYLCILDPSKFTALITLPMEECSWQKINAPTEAELLLPSFYVHFPEIDEVINNENDGRSRLLQVFSKQAVMMDALLNSSAQIRMQEMDLSPDDDEDVLDSQKAPGQRLFATRRFRMDQTDSPVIDDPMYKAKLSRLCTASFDSNGSCLEARGLLKTILDESDQAS